MKSVAWILSLLFAAAVWAADPTPPLSVVAFGSCLDQNKPQTIWKAVAGVRPHLFILLGDTIYPQGQRPTDLRAAYNLLKNNAHFRTFRKSYPIMAVWDDHDYGKNDGGLEYEYKEHAQWEFKNFFRMFENKETAEREGVYSSAIHGPKGQEVQVILLDARYFRSPLKRNSNGTVEPDTDESSTMLGGEQWRWLEAELEKPAALRIIGSGVPVLPRSGKGEKWAQFPLERDKLLGLLRDKNANGVILISGDRHFAELSAETGIMPYPLYELTSSPLESSVDKANAAQSHRSRVSAYAGGRNFGVIKIDWKSEDPVVTLEIRDAAGGAQIKKSFPLSQIQ